MYPQARPRVAHIGSTRCKPRPVTPDKLGERVIAAQRVNRVVCPYQALVFSEARGNGMLGAAAPGLPAPQRATGVDDVVPQFKLIVGHS
jgi:hypothetical protein